MNTCVPSCFSPTALTYCPGYPHPPCARCIAFRPVPVSSTPVLCHLLNSDVRCPCSLKFKFDHISVVHLAGSKKHFLFCHRAVPFFRFSRALSLCLSRVSSLSLSSLGHVSLSFRSLVVEIWFLTAESSELRRQRIDFNCKSQWR